MIHYSCSAKQNWIFPNTDWKNVHTINHTGTFGSFISGVPVITMRLRALMNCTSFAHLWSIDCRFFAFHPRWQVVARGRYRGGGADH